MLLLPAFPLYLLDVVDADTQCKFDHNLVRVASGVLRSAVAVNQLTTVRVYPHVYKSIPIGVQRSGIAVLVRHGPIAQPLEYLAFWVKKCKLYNGNVPKHCLCVLLHTHKSIGMLFPERLEF